MIRISDYTGDFFLVKTLTNHTFVIEKIPSNNSDGLLELCKAVVEIAQAGHIVTGLYQLTDNSSGQRVTYRNSKAYKEAKKQYAEEKEKNSNV